MGRYFVALLLFFASMLGPRSRLQNPQKSPSQSRKGKLVVMIMTSSLHEWIGLRTREAPSVSSLVKLKSQGGAYMPSPEFNKFLEMAEVHWE